MAITSRKFFLRRSKMLGFLDEIEQSPSSGAISIYLPSGSSAPAIEDLLQKVENPPEKNKSVHEKLFEMYNIYVKLHDLALKPSAPQEEYEASVYKLYDELLKEAGELHTLLGR